MEDQSRTLIDAAVEHLPKANVHTITGGYDHMVAVSDPANITTRFEDLERFADAPRRVRETERFETPKSFAEYVKDFTVSGRTRIFASLEGRTVKAKLDYHSPQAVGPADPSWVDHNAIYEAKFDDSFGAWRAIHDKLIPQRAFAEFLEDRAEDAVTPEPADLMEIAERFAVLRNVNFESNVALTSNARQFTYSEDDTVKGTVRMDKFIKLHTPIFYGCESVDWVARVAYDISEKKLFFKISIHRLSELLDREFQHLVDGIAVDLPGVPVHRAAV